MSSEPDPDPSFGPLPTFSSSKNIAPESLQRFIDKQKYQPLRDKSRYMNSLMLNTLDIEEVKAALNLSVESVHLPDTMNSMFSPTKPATHSIVQGLKFNSTHVDPAALQESLYEDSNSRVASMLQNSYKSQHNKLARHGSLSSSSSIASSSSNLVALVEGPAAARV